jgi:xanthine/uracil/vitamin C permease (AzgA family)
VVGHPPRRERRHWILWRRHGHPPEDDDDDDNDDNNDDVGVTLFAGNVYYSWQAIHLTNLHGRQYTAQPYGLNTPAAFSFVFNIIYAIFFQERGGNAGFIKGYKVALAANFINGLISVVLGCFDTLILKAVPPAALLVPISGIILIGVILGWATGLNKSADVVGASKLVKWWGPVWTAGEMFDDLGIVIPIGISSAATMSTQCNQSMEHIWSTLLHNRWNVFIGCRRNTSQRIS